MVKHLYKAFDNWYHGGRIFLYSDPHFSDLESYKFRFPEVFKQDETAKMLFEKILGKEKAEHWFEDCVRELDQMQINNINKTCSKNDTLVILGDVGNVECIKKLKADYKVLLLGNHDSGTSNYKRVIATVKYPFALSPEQYEAYKKIEKDFGYIDGPGDFSLLGRRKMKFINDAIKEDFKGRELNDAHLLYDNNGDVKTEYNSEDDSWSYFVEFDNKLFDEVYEGPLFVSAKILLSHEPVEFPFAYNIHGHVHEKNYVSKGLNVCAEHIHYTPVCLNTLIKAGKLKDVKDIHRQTIDKAIKRKASK